MLFVLALVVFPLVAFIRAILNPDLFGGGKIAWIIALLLLFPISSWVYAFSREEGAFRLCGILSLITTIGLAVTYLHIG